MMISFLLQLRTVMFKSEGQSQVHKVNLEVGSSSVLE